MIAPKGPMWVPVMHELLDRIVTGAYPEGSALPSEGQLGAEFDVSRTVLRESVKVLTEKGLVSTWRGRGTIVEPAKHWRTFDPDLLAARLRHPGGEVVVRELLILRKGIEPVLASMAALAADDEQRASLQRRFDDLERWKDDPASYVLADGDFHAEIAEMSGVVIARDLFDLMAEPFTLARRGTALIPGGQEIAHAQHRAILDGILARDGAASSAAMYEHMQSAEDRLAQLEWSTDRLVLPAAPPRRT
ncbi:FadR/GntR family transcriptional regulator [Kineosporia sp. A_224]|uniref:FadR/GntR family transcriptional regulator n=1 Tax=Kineosporia sp. A_224 TaxID=1962180 RepID=UPI0013044AEB|nr:FadR/GntR family transcriptional regulator [Kineosporia sp. A_224]